MSGIGDFQDRVNNTLGQGWNFQVDRPHDEKPAHVDLTRILQDLGGADKCEVDFNGNVIGGSTQIGRIKMPWDPA